MRRAARCAGVRVARWVLLVVCVAQVLGMTAKAGGPRFVGGTTYCCYVAGRWMQWYTSQPQYYTDPGVLSSAVTHAQSDAMVAAAAAVWNVPTANITLAQGGALSEHVSSANMYFDGTNVVFPTDVMAANYAAKQIAVIYDTDGSVTDSILGGGASDPRGCRQTGVTESVDAFGTYGTIDHAVIVLNGRCVAAGPQSAQQLLQMQYQLARAFGQVLGLAWSQLNDNVFTGATPPNANQVNYWPLMHPIDVICATYTYQCMTKPFTLRADDLSALSLLYPVGAAGGGKTPSLANADGTEGWVYFPGGQGMELVNVTVSRDPEAYQAMEDWQEVSGVSGIYYQQNGGNLFGGEPASENVGLIYPDLEARFYIGSIPLSAGWTSLNFATETINPLYAGQYAIGPYQRPPITMSGSTHSAIEPFAVLGTSLQEWITMSDAATDCNTSGDGTPTNPVAADPSGFWSGTMCPVGHNAWWSASVKANRSFAVETTAVDETGEPTTQKLQPVVGVWDSRGNVGATTTPMNGLALGTTELQMPVYGSSDSILIGIDDQFGAGRPDFAYKMRMLYADSVAPATLGKSGGQVTITGTGFRAGNRVTVNGVNATAVSWTPTQIVAMLPSMALADPTGVAVDVAVIDASTGGTTVMQGAMVYTGAGTDGVKIVTSPAALETGLVAATPFAVRVYESDGVTEVKSASVRFAVTQGSATMGCGAGTSCTVTTDATGLAQTTLAGVAAGNVTVSATELSGGASVQITIADSNPVRTVTIAGAAQYLAAGASGQWSVPLVAMQDGAAAAGDAVVWSASAGSGLTLTPSQGTTGTNGGATTVVGAPAIAGPSTNVVTGCVWTTVCANWTVYGVGQALWTVGVQSGAGQSVAYTAGLAPVTLLVTDGAGHALPGAMVTVHQTVYAWEGVCGMVQCPAAPVLSTAVTTAMSDGSGMVDVTPLQVAGVPEVVQIAAATGTKGFVTLTLVKTP